MKIFRWYSITTFTLGLLLINISPNFAHEVVVFAPKIWQVTNLPFTSYGFNFEQSQLFSWWSWDTYILGFAGYICFGVGAIALSNPLQNDTNNLQRPSINLLLLHIMVAGTAGFFTVVLERNQELSALLTGGAYLVLIANFGPDNLRIHQNSH